MSRIIDADKLFAVVKRHHDLYKGATNPADKARRDECLQVMCDINDAPTIDAIPVEWLEEHDGKDIRDSDGNIYGRRGIAVLEALSIWQKEQGAR